MPLVFITIVITFIYTFPQTTYRNTMSVPCEVVVKCVLPVIRAMLATTLATKYHMKQVEIARLLKVSQPAVSLYYRRIRGKAMSIENDAQIMQLIEKFAQSLAKNEVSQEDFMLRFCQICTVIRAKGLMCHLHKMFDPTVDTEKCKICIAKTELCRK